MRNARLEGYPLHPFDGSPEEFPRRDEAMKEYQLLWVSFLLIRDRDLAVHLCDMMDELQFEICHGPGPVWNGFVQTLPGFVQFWDKYMMESEAEVW